MRIRELDFLRGIAVLMVFCSHAPFTFLLSKIGYTGVEFFFVLSGFLVSNLLFAEYKKTGTVNPFKFLIRRGFKIYPLFYFMIGLTLVVKLYLYKDFFLPNDITAKNLISELLFWQNMDAYMVPCS